MDNEAAPPAFRTVADKVKLAPDAGLLSLTVGDPTTKSGSGSGTVTAMAPEQLFVVSDSPVTASTQAP